MDEKVAASDVRVPWKEKTCLPDVVGAPIDTVVAVSVAAETDVAARNSLACAALTVAKLIVSDDDTAPPTDKTAPPKAVKLELDAVRRTLETAACKLMTFPDVATNVVPVTDRVSEPVIPPTITLPDAVVMVPQFETVTVFTVPEVRSPVIARFDPSVEMVLDAKLTVRLVTDVAAMFVPAAESVLDDTTEMLIKDSAVELKKLLPLAACIVEPVTESAIDEADPSTMFEAPVKLVLLASVMPTLLLLVPLNTRLFARVDTALFVKANVMEIPETKLKFASAPPRIVEACTVIPNGPWAVPPTKMLPLPVTVGQFVMSRDDVAAPTAPRTFTCIPDVADTSRADENVTPSCVTLPPMYRLSLVPATMELPESTAAVNEATVPLTHTFPPLLVSVDDDVSEMEKMESVVQVTMTFPEDALIADPTAETEKVPPSTMLVPSRWMFTDVDPDAVSVVLVRTNPAVVTGTLV